MPADDTIYNAVKNALIKDGWTITHDPYTVKFGSVRVHADLAAEKILAAEKGGRTHCRGNQELHRAIPDP